MKEILDTIHKTIYQFFDVCGEDEECNISDKDKLLLEVNKAICTNLKALEPKEPFINKPCVSEQACHEDKMQVLKKIRKEIEENRDEWLKGQDPEWHAYDRCIAIIDKYIAESECKE